MVRSAAVVLFLVSATAAYGQDVLLPHDVLESGEFSGTARVGMGLGQGNLESPGLEVDFDTQSLTVFLEAGIGVGKGFEFEATIPLQPWSVVEGDGTLGALDIETEEEDLGFGDLELRANYRLLKGTSIAPQWVISLVVVAPTGNDKRGESEVTSGGTTLQEGEEGGIGNGVWSYGVSTAVGMDVGGVELYGVAQYIFGGNRERNDVDEERADTFTLLVGLEVPISGSASLDFRAGVVWVGEDIKENNRAEQVAEAHLTYPLTIQAFIQLAPGVTLIAGGQATLVADHEADKDLDQELQDVFTTNIFVGLHVVLGVSMGARK